MYACSTARSSSGRSDEPDAMRKASACAAAGAAAAAAVAASQLAPCSARYVCWWRVGVRTDDE